MVLFVNLTFASSFPFHEQHVRSMQIFEKLIMHVGIEQDFPYPVGRTVSKHFFKYKLSKQITCLINAHLRISAHSQDPKIE